MWIDVEQNSEEWFDLRLGRATSSNFAKIMANDGKAFGSPAIDYAQKLALEHVTGERDETGFHGAYMDRGQELEPLAIEAYEIDQIAVVTNGGFNKMGDFLGDSPDGNVGKKGCIETKSVVPNTQWKRIKKGGIDLAYKWQIHGHIWLGEKDWCDFVSYCPEMNDKNRLYVHRVHRDKEMISKMNDRMLLFLEEVRKNINILS